jgi:hypothetical protein
MREKTLLMLLVSLPACWIAAGSSLPPPVLNPTTHVSPSGGYSLFVNPSDLYGGGPAEYRFTKSNEVLWTKRLPFTFWKAVVTDSGQIAGYGYTHGPDGFSESGYAAGMGEFVVATLSAAGDLVKQDVYVREHSNFPDSYPDPLGRGIALDGFSERFIVRVADPDLNRGIEQWWIYDLRSGERTHTLEPERELAADGRYHSIFAARAVPGTPLMLIHWRCYSKQRGRPGAVFTLVDGKGRQLWSLHRKGDYAVPFSRDKEEKIRRWIGENGAILDVRKDGTFDLHFVKQELRASFAVSERAPGDWVVEKLGEEPYAWPDPSPSPPSFPALQLRQVGEASLSRGSTGGESRISDIVAFEFDPAGRICALREGPGTPPSLLLLSPQGEILKELPLPANKIPEDGAFSNPAYVGDSRFVLCVSEDLEIEGKARFFLADFASGETAIIPIRRCPSVDAVAGFSDGRFAVLTTRDLGCTMVDGLFIYNLQGRRLWKKEQYGTSGKPDDLLSPEDIASYGTNEIAVLDNIAKTIQVWDLDGDLVKVLDLEATWGREPNYPTDISPDRDRGFLVYDFDAEHALVQLDPEGSILSESTPRFQDGRPFYVVDGVKRSPLGELWTSDGHSLLRLDADGTVNRIVGQAPSTSILSAPGRVHVGPDDRVYVADQRTRAIHVFDSSGKRLGQCIPQAQDLTELSDVAHIALSQDGHVFARLSRDTRYLEFDSELTRKGWSAVDVDPITQEWYFQPSTDLCWIVGYNDIFLVRSLQQTVRRISRRADGRWLEYPGSAAVGPDGSLAVLAHNQTWDTSITIYSSAGDARSTFDIPDELCWCSLACDGRLVYVRDEREVYVYQTDGRSAGKFSIPSNSAKAEWAGPHVAAKGNEIWFLDTDAMKLHRYAVPDQLAGLGVKTAHIEPGMSFALIRTRCCY